MDDDVAIADIFDGQQSTLSEWTGSGKGAESADVDTLVGTFRDNADAPIHRWFRYQAGFSFELVGEFLDRLAIGPGDRVLDPFAGVGTTVVEAKRRGATADGVEVHPFVAWVAERKTDWEVDVAGLRAAASDLRTDVERALSERDPLAYLGDDPEFLKKVFEEATLGRLYAIEAVIEEAPAAYRGPFRMALVACLRDVCTAKTVFPYVQPASRKDATPPVRTAFEDTLEMVVEDLAAVVREAASGGESTIHRADARSVGDAVPDGSVDAVVTSPPYLNNVDYADVTRLELYFLGYASSWSEITDAVRRDLVNSSTVVLQGVDDDVRPRPELPEDLREEIISAAAELAGIREEKDYSGKRYDVMVPAYFNDMYAVLSGLHDTMRSGAYALFVLGDSAPYGVHVPTDVYLGRIGEAVGFAVEEVYEIRERGDTWTSIKGSRRHDVDLRESLLLFHKP